MTGTAGSATKGRGARDPRLDLLGERIVRLRLLLGHERRTVLAALLGVGNDALRTYEEGRTTPPSAMILRLADVLGCTTDHLLSGTTAGMPEDTVRALGEITTARIAAAKTPGPVRRKK